MNLQILTGNLGKDPELKKLESGNTVCRFSIATNETWKDKYGEKQTETTWHDCQSWGKQAEIISQYFHKGEPITVIGKKKVRKWTDNDGQTRYEHFTQVGSFEFPPVAKPKPESSPETAPPVDNQDVPF